MNFFYEYDAFGEQHQTVATYSGGSIATENLPLCTYTCQEQEPLVAGLIYINWRWYDWNHGTLSRREKGDLSMCNLTFFRHVLALWALFFIPTCLLHAAEPAQVAPAQASQNMVLWYRQPATAWLQAMPLGNGMIGAMVFGGVPQERIALNESSFWSGRPHNYDNPEAFQYFPQIRDLVFAGQVPGGREDGQRPLLGHPQVAGGLPADWRPASVLRGRQRHRLSPRVGHGDRSRQSQLSPGDAVITRQAFVSWPDRVLVVRISADKPGRVSVGAQFRGPYLETSVANRGRLVMDGTWKGPFSAPPTGMDGLIARTEGKGLRYEAALAARLEGGRSEAAGSTLNITNADAVTLVLAVATSFVNYHDISGDPAARCKKVLDAVADKDFATLYRRHVDDFRGLMGRVHLNLGDAALNAKPTDQRLQAVRAGGVDPNLEALCFQFGRYILASSSRAGGQPANLQGIWNEAVLPPWGSKYTININVEMNYWPAEVCNLAECHQPLFDLIKDLSETGARTAKTYYNCGGWVLHHNTDLWRGTAPVDAAKYGMWPVGGAWLCQHLWEHYAFGGDEKFLRENYPVMRGVRPVPAGTAGRRAETPLAGHAVLHVARAHLSGQGWEHGVLVAGADDGHRPHPRVVLALHRGRQDSGRG